MKILIVSQYFWPEYFRVNDLVLELKKKNVEIEILTSYPNYPDGKIFEEFKKIQINIQNIMVVKFTEYPK